MKKITKLLLTVCTCCTLSFAAGCSAGTNQNVSEADAATAVENQSSENTESEKTGKQTIKVSAVGDFLIHSQILNTQKTSDGYDFSYNYEVVKPYLEEPDLMIANLETTLSGPENGYSGYPCFNSPDELSEEMKNIGIDVVANMSNHSLDRSDSGAKRTRQVLKDDGFDIIGTRETENDKKYVVRDVDGIKVGITAYCYSFKDNSGRPTLNGIPISDDMQKVMNFFDPSNLEASEADMKQQIEDMKKDGADAVIFYMHWGEEYLLAPVSYQKELAQFLADSGVDIIYGDHPHVVEPYDVIKSSDGNHETKVIYSLGNFISCQRASNGRPQHTEDGVIINFDITKDWDTGEITVENASYLATWVKNDNGKYQVISEKDVDKLDISEATKQNARASFARTKEIINANSAPIVSEGKE